MFRKIRFDSPEYHAAFRLRDAVLRQPLGLRLEDDGLGQEAGQLHFGLFASDGELLASVTVAELRSDTAKIRQMVVSPDHQHQGLGTELMSELESALLDRGYRRFVLHARLSAAGFYRTLGYRKQGEPFEEVTIPHVHMEKHCES